MKRILIIFALMLMLTGCAKVETASPEPVNVSMFKEIEKTYTWVVVYHRKTKVMYAVSNYGAGAGVFTLLVNPDGTPMLYEGTE